MLMTGAPSRVEEVVAQDLHVAGEHHEVDVPLQEVELALLHRGLVAVRERDVHERHAERAHVGREVRVVGHDHWVISMSSSPRRARHSRSMRQWSYFDTKIATFLRRRGVVQRPLHPESLGHRGEGLARARDARPRGPAGGTPCAGRSGRPAASVEC